MRALKTIVATAVIVFTLTTVAMAGVQHFTKQDDTTGGTQTRQAQAVQPTFSITMTVAQLKALIGSQGDNAAKAKANGRRDRHQDQERDGDHVTTRSHTRTSWTGTASATTRSGTRSGNGPCYDNDHHGDWNGGSQGDCDRGCW